MGYHLRLFGATEVERDGVPVRGFVSRKALALLGYLAVQQRAVPRSYLAHLLWEEKSEARGRGNLSRLVNNLSELLPDCLITDYHSLQINPNALTWIDTQHFAALLARGDLEAKRQAVDLYRGDLMADLRLRDSPEFDQWLAGEQERWRREIIQLLQQLISHYRQAEGDEQAIPLAQRLVTMAPWLEEAHQALMLMLARGGQRGAALAQYENCRRALANELGAEPAAETVQLYQRIRAMEEQPRVDLPGQPTPFVGRDAELTSVTRLLLDPTCRLLTLTGPGGMGKTRLAIQATGRIAAFKYLAFLNGIVFVPLASVPTPDLLVFNLAQALRLSLYGAGDPAERLLSHLRDQEILLILDNFEHLLAGAGFVTTMLEQAPALKLLVTSRARLNLRWEWLFPLEGLDIPDAPVIPEQKQRNGTDKPAARQPARAESDRSPSTPPAGQFGALRLFEQVVRRVQPGFALSSMTLPDSVQICRLVGGLPLGIELAATRLQDQSVNEVAQGIARNLGYLRTGYHDLPERHRSLQAVFDYSWSFLAPAEQDVLKKLSVFEGGFSQAAAEQVASATAGRLSTLVNHSLLRQEATGRYDLHELIRQYAADKLRSDAAVDQTISDRHSAYYLTYVWDRALDRKKGREVAFDEIEGEMANIRLAWSRATTRLNAAGLQQAAPGLFDYFEVRGGYREGFELFGQTRGSILSALSELNRHRGAEQRLLSQTYTELTMWHSWFAMRLGHLKEAQTLVSHPSLNFDPLLNSNHWYKAFPFYIKGLLDWYLGNFPAARQHFENGLALCLEKNTVRVKAAILSHLGLTAFALGNYAESQQWHVASRHLAQTVSDHNLTGQQYIMLGKLACALKEYDEAGRLIDEGLKICETTQHFFSIAFGLINRSLVSWQRGKPVEGQKHCLKALSICNDIEDQYGQALALDHLGQITWAMGNYSESKQYFLDALRISTGIGLAPRMLAALAGLAKHLNREGNPVKALALLICVANHPASEYIIIEETQHILAELSAQLGPSAVVEARENATQPNLETLARELLDR